MKKWKLNKESDNVLGIDLFMKFIKEHPEAYEFILSLKDNKRK